MRNLMRSRHHCINPVDSRETGHAEAGNSGNCISDEPEDVKIFDGFTGHAGSRIKGTL